MLRRAKSMDGNNIIKVTQTHTAVFIIININMTGNVDLL